MRDPDPESVLYGRIHELEELNAELLAKLKDYYELARDKETAKLIARAEAIQP